MESRAFISPSDGRLRESSYSDATWNINTLLSTCQQMLTGGDRVPIISHRFDGQPFNDGAKRCSSITRRRR